MTYSTLSATWSYWQLVVPTALLVMTIGAFVLVFSPPKEKLAYTARRRSQIALVALVMLAVSVRIFWNVTDKTTGCADPQLLKKAATVEGPITVLATGKYLKFAVNEQQFMSSGSTAPSECGLILSLGQSLEPQSGYNVRLKAWEGKVVWFEQDARSR
jgi:hypothetical protein